MDIVPILPVHLKQYFSVHFLKTKPTKLGKCNQLIGKCSLESYFCTAFIIQSYVDQLHENRKYLGGPVR